MQRTIQKIEITKLLNGESDPGAISGLTLRRTKTFAGLGAASDETHVIRIYEDDTVIPVDYWLPTDDASLGGWWDPSDTATITHSTGNVSSVADKSPTGAAMTGGISPRTGDATLNGLNVLSFDNTDYLEASIGSGVTEDTFIVSIVARADTVDNSADSLFSIYEGDHMRLDAGNATAFNGRLFSNKINNGVQSLSSPPHAGPSVYTLVCDVAGGTATVFVDGTPYAPVTYTAGLTAAWALLWFANWDSTKDGPVGVSGDIMVFFGTSSSTIREKSEGYLAHKWGLEANLPGAHPYKSTPPLA